MIGLDLRFLARWSGRLIGIVPTKCHIKNLNTSGDELAPSVLGALQEQIVRAALDRQRLNLGRVDKPSCKGADVC